ncbi:MAG: hypothetical protein KDH09_13880 [Chrysiogenetes bacterium]|nr:hypothetical protein [Chrysiogenetes bacterium]
MNTDNRILAASMPLVYAQKMETTPKSEIATTTERPRAVTWACWLAWVLLAIDVFDTIHTTGGLLPGYVSFRLMPTVVEAYVILQLGRGQRWARDGYVTLAAIAALAFVTVSVLAIFGTHRQPTSEWVVDTSVFISILMLLYWLTGPNANMWFARQPKRLLLSFAVASAIVALTFLPVLVAMVQELFL